MSALIPIRQAIETARNPMYPAMEMLVLSHSSLGVFDSCERKMEFRQFFGTPLVKEDSYPGDVGNAIHRGFGEWLITEDEDKAIMAYALKFPFAQEFSKPSNSQRSFEAGVSTLLALTNHGFLRQHQIVKINTLDKGVQYGVEVPFAFHITGAPFPFPVYFVGFIDCVLYNHITGRFIVTDLKTTRMNMDDPTALYQYDQQTIPYGVILEHLLNKPIREFETAYLHCYIDLLEPKVRLLEYTKSEQDLLDWKLSLFNKIDRMAHSYKTGMFMRASHGTTCMSYNRACYFHDVCMHREHRVLQMIVGGEPRKELFSTGEKPWVIAELPYERT